MDTYWSTAVNKGNIKTKPVVLFSNVEQKVNSLYLRSEAICLQSTLEEVPNVNCLEVDNVYMV